MPAHEHQTVCIKALTFSAHNSGRALCFKEGLAIMPCNARMVSNKVKGRCSRSPWKMRLPVETTSALTRCLPLPNQTEHE